MKRGYLTKKTLPLVLALSMALSACAASTDAEETASMTEEVQGIPVEVLQVKMAEINRELVYNGQVKPVEQVAVVPKMGGKVVSVNYEVGDTVRKNDPLFVLDSSDLQSSVDAAQAQYNAALAGVKSAQAGVQSAQAGVKSAQAGVDTAQVGVESAQVGLDMVKGSQAEGQLLQLENGLVSAKSGLENAEIAVENAALAVDNAKLQLDNVRTSYENSQLLYEAGAMAKVDFDQIELGYNQAISGYEQAQLAYNQAKVGKEQATTGVAQAQDAYDLYVNRTKADTVRQAQSGVSQAQSGVNQAQSSVNQAQSSVAQAQSGVTQAQASADASKVQLDTARKNMADLTTTAPISGVISSKNVTVGTMASPSITAYTIINIETVEVLTNVSEELINNISVGMKVPVYIRTISDKPLEGVISSINPAADEMNHTYPVKITIKNTSGRLKPGMFSEIHFTKEKSAGTIVLPRNTVIDEEDSRYVFIEENGVARKQEVTTGIDNGQEIEILTGVQPGDCVIVKGQTQVTDGEAVEVVDAE